MANETLDLIKKAETKAEDIRVEAKNKARDILAKAQADAEEAISEAEIDARNFKQQTLQDVSAKASKLIDAEAEEAKYDASKVLNHADRVRDKAVSYITGQITGKID